MRVPIELNTGKEVEAFTKLVQTVDVDVRLVGKDENGNPWEMSAKSLFCSLVLAARVQHRKHTAHDLDWNTLYCVCEKDIYSLIKDYIRGSELENDLVGNVLSDF